MKGKVSKFARNISVAIILIFSSNSFGQTISKGLIPDELTLTDKDTLLLIYNDQTDNKMLKNYLCEFFKGNYKLVSLNELLTEEEYLDKKKYRFMLCHDTGDIFNENDGSFKAPSYLWCILDREKHIRNIHVSAFPMDEQLTDIGKKLEKKRTK